MVSASRSSVVFASTNTPPPHSQLLEIWHFLPILDRIVHGYTTSLQTFPMVKLRPRPSLSDSPTLRVSLFRFDHRCKIKKTHSDAFSDANLFKTAFKSAQDNNKSLLSGNAAPTPVESDAPISADVNTDSTGAPITKGTESAPSSEVVAEAEEQPKEDAPKVEKTEVVGGQEVTESTDEVSSLSLFSLFCENSLLTQSYSALPRLTRMPTLRNLLPLTRLLPTKLVFVCSIPSF